MKPRFFFYSLMSAVLLASGCQTTHKTVSAPDPSPARQARAELEKRNIAFKADTFVQKAGEGEAGAVELLLQAGINVDATNQYGYTGLMWAAGQGREAMVEVLLAKGAPAGLMVFGFACFTNLSAGLTNYGTTPSPMFFAQDYVSMKTWWRIGLIVSFLNIAIWGTIGFGWWKLLRIW